MFATVSILAALRMMCNIALGVCQDFYLSGLDCMSASVF